MGRARSMSVHSSVAIRVRSRRCHESPRGLLEPCKAGAALPRAARNPRHFGVSAPRWRGHSEQKLTSCAPTRDVPRAAQHESVRHPSCHPCRLAHRSAAIDRRTGARRPRRRRCRGPGAGCARRRAGTVAGVGPSEEPRCLVDGRREASGDRFLSPPQASRVQCGGIHKLDFPKSLTRRRLGPLGRSAGPSTLRVMVRP